MLMRSLLLVCSFVVILSLSLRFCSYIMCLGVRHYFLCLKFGLCFLSEARKEVSSLRPHRRLATEQKWELRPLHSSVSAFPHSHLLPTWVCSALCSCGSLRWCGRASNQGSHLRDNVLSLIGRTFIGGRDSVFLFLNFIDKQCHGACMPAHWRENRLWSWEDLGI